MRCSVFPCANRREVSMTHIEHDGKRKKRNDRPILEENLTKHEHNNHVGDDDDNTGHYTNTNQ